MELALTKDAQKLVAAAVPKLDVKNVSIIDSAGNLLTNDFSDPNSPAVKNVNNELCNGVRPRLSGVVKR